MGAIPSKVVPVPELVESGPASKPAPRQPSRWLRWGMIAGVACVLAAAGLYWRSHRQNSIVYETVAVERGSLQAKVTATGNLNAVVEVMVSSQVSGNIKALYADWNSRVKKGQLVALIDPEVFQSQVDQASASSRSAHASMLTATAQLAKAHADMSAAAANERNTQAIAAKSLANQINVKAQWERAQKLFGLGILARQEYDTARANYGAATAQLLADAAQVRATQQSVRAAHASVQVAENQLGTAEAQVGEAQAALRQAQINLDRTRITAPVDGTVIARRMDVGQTVASTLNPPTIFEIAQDLTKMQVDTNVDESDIGKIAVGQRATFLVDSYPGTAFQGVVAEIRKAPIITQNVVTYDVVIAVDNRDLRLFPGMTANVTILTARLDNTLKVANSVLRFHPSPAVMKKNGLSVPPPDQAQVYVLKNQKLKAVPVTFGLSDGRSTAISSDEIRAGEQVVVRATAKANASNGTRSPIRPMMPRM